MIASANDFQLRASSGGGKVYVTVFTRANVTFDGGRTWTVYPIPYKGYDFTGDSSVAFDANGTAYLASDAILVSQDALFPVINPTSTSFNSRGIVSGDVVVASSTDGGKTWSAPVRVASGVGTDYTRGTFNDKSYLTAWGNGHVLITWTAFNFKPRGSTNINEPLEAAVSHDAGASWTAPTVISGAASFCAQSPFSTPTSPPSCDQSNFSVPVVAADGTVHVAFETNSSSSTFRGAYAEVQLDSTTGQRIAGPFEVATVIDGATDYPFNQYGWQTYQDSQFRTNADGNIAADPTNTSHLAVVWSDVRDRTLPAPSDPYSTSTNSDIVVSQSYDGGQTWSAPVALQTPGDQFQPWSAYDSTGRLRIGYYDRSYDPANHKYGYTLASETTPASLSFTTTELSTALSDPTQLATAAAPRASSSRPAATSTRARAMFASALSASASVGFGERNRPLHQLKRLLDLTRQGERLRPDPEPADCRLQIAAGVRPCEPVAGAAEQRLGRDRVAGEQLDDPRVRGELMQFEHQTQLFQRDAAGRQDLTGGGRNVIPSPLGSQ